MLIRSYKYQIISINRFCVLVINQTSAELAVERSLSLTAQDPDSGATKAGLIAATDGAGEEAGRGGEDDYYSDYDEDEYYEEDEGRAPAPARAPGTTEWLSSAA